MKEQKKMGLVHITMECLKEWLQLDDKASVNTVFRNTDDIAQHTFSVLISHPNLDEIREGSQIPYIYIEHIQKK